ncbi:ABC transporter substrate-binding protein [Clostridia bacterium]|nr:ABC transporter substrate-binding protein [Clostridia bacterium]
MKKALAIALAMLMIVTLFVACASNDAKSSPGTTPSSGGGTVDPAKAVEITILLEGSNVSDSGAVVSAINDYLAELNSGIKLKPIYGTWGDFEGKATTALDTGDSSIDILFTCSWTQNNFVQYSKKGAYAKLDELLDQYGTALKAAVPQSLWDAVTVAGGDGEAGIYGVPGYKDYAQLYTWDVNNTRLKELGIDIDTFNGGDWSSDAFFSDAFADACKAAKEKYGDSFYPINFENELPGRAISNLDSEGTGLLAYEFDPKDPSKPAVVKAEARFENARYKKYLDKVHEYYTLGYIDPGIASAGEETASNTKVSRQNSGEYLFGIYTYAYGFDQTASAERGIDARFPAMSKAIVSSATAQGSVYAVSVYSKHKEEAVKFLNLWYTDKKLANLFAFGIEGINYTVKDGLLDFGTPDDPETADVDEADQIGKAHGSYLPWQYGMGNLFIQTPNVNQGASFFEEFKAYNDEGIATSLAGFTFDTEPVQTELAALYNVRGEYQLGLNYGQRDPATDLPAFNEKLKANGIDKVVAELQKQLDAFYASK